jgi:hypothetical protein
MGWRPFKGILVLVDYMHFVRHTATVYQITITTYKAWSKPITAQPLEHQRNNTVRVPEMPVLTNNPLIYLEE